MTQDEPDLRKLADLVHNIAVEVVADPGKSFNAFCIAHRLDWEAQKMLRNLLQEASFGPYYGGLESGTIDVRAIEASYGELAVQLKERFGWDGQVLTELLRACMVSGIVRGYCATVLDLEREKLFG